MTIEDEARSEAWDDSERPTIGLAREIAGWDQGNPATSAIPHWAVNLAAHLLDKGWHQSKPSEPEGNRQLWRHTLSYAAVALEGSGDNGDRYCARQIREHLAQSEPRRTLPVPEGATPRSQHDFDIATGRPLGPEPREASEAEVTAALDSWYSEALKGAHDELRADVYEHARDRMRAALNAARAVRS